MYLRKWPIAVLLFGLAASSCPVSAADAEGQTEVERAAPKPVPSVAAQDKDKQTAPAVEITPDLRELLAEAGLGHLSNDDQKRVLILLANILANAEKTDERTRALARVAEMRLMLCGYTLCSLEVVQVDLKDSLLVTSGRHVYVTDDLPYGFPRYGFRNGKYLCRERPLGGISAMVDVQGMEHQLYLAEWKQLR